MSLAVHLRSAVCLLGRFPALAGVDLDVRTGEVVLLAGPNGAGKTTLLRALAGLVPVVDGTAVVLGHDLRVDRRTVRRHLGLVGHSTSLYDDLTRRRQRPLHRTRRWRPGRRHPPRPRPAGPRRPPRWPCRRVACRPGSGGARPWRPWWRRDPELWLLDEPHAGLDPEGRDLVDALCREARDRGRTVVLASHDLERATALADRQVTIAGGLATRRTPRRRRPPVAPPPRLRACPCPRPCPWRPPVWADAALVAGKDLRIELRSRVGANQVLPVRRCGPGAVRVRPRPRPRGARPGRPRAVLDRRRC